MPLHAELEEIIQIQAEMMKTFSHPARLRILKAVCQKEHSAAEILALTHLSKTNLSQHMKQLVGSGIVSSRKEGVQVFYRVSNPKVSKACQLMQEIALEILVQKTKILNRIK